MKEKLKRHKKKLIAAGIILILVISIAVLKSNSTKRQQAMIQAMNKTETAVVEKRTLMSSISATGSITSADSKEISVALNNTEVESVNVKVGDMVEAGTVLCVFDSQDIEENLAQAQTNLNVTTTKTQMDIASAQKSLDEAIENSSIETQRINSDVANALSDYEEAKKEIDTAKSAYDNAKNEAASIQAKIDEYNTNKKAYTQKKTKAVNNFDTTKAELTAYITANTDTCKDTAQSVIDSLLIDNTISITASDILIDGADTATVDGLLTTLTKAQKQYQSATEKLSALGDLSTLQKKYETANANAEALEKTYEQSVTNADSKYEAYVQKLRNQEDTTRNNESTIESRTDNVTTAKLNASTSGSSDREQIEQYQEQLKNCTVTSPISGVITAINIEAGDTYSGAAIATIEDISSYKITTEIDEYDIVDVEVGQKVVIKTNGTGDLELDGTVESIAPRATAAAGNSSNVTYTVTITVDTPCDDLRLDMTAKLSIILESKENVLTVPYNAVLEDEDGNFYVEVVEDNTTSDFDKKDTADNNNMIEEIEGEIPADMPDIPDMNGKMPTDMPDMNSEIPMAGNRGKAKNTNSSNSSVQTKRIYVTKGIESDYYIEIISNEITEGMQVVVPQTEDTQSIQNMMMNRGPMGGF